MTFAENLAFAAGSSFSVSRPSGTQILDGMVFPIYLENIMVEFVDGMSDVELLGMLVGGKSAVRMLEDAGSITALLNQSIAPYDPQPRLKSRLLAAKELVRRSLLEKLAQGNALNSPSSVRDYLRMSLAARDYEVFVVMFLDAQNRVIKSEEMFRGTLTQTSVYPREVVKRCLALNAGAAIFAHNHPSGIAEPSHADETLTQSLKQALALVDVRVLDHFIVAGTSVLSFAERGLL